MRKRVTGNAKVAVAYIRVSTTEQRLGPEAQRAAIEAWAAREGVQVAAWHVDQGVSGAATIEDRKGLCEALSALREHGAGLLLVAKRDRIARDVVVAASVMRAAAKAGASLVSVDGTGNGDSPAEQFMRTVIDGAAAYERDLIRARTKAALAAKAAKGERTGMVAYGWRVCEDGVHLEHEPVEQTILGIVANLRAIGRTQRAIVAYLTEKSLFSRSGKPFHVTSVARMLAA